MKERGTAESEKVNNVITYLVSQLAHLTKESLELLQIIGVRWMLHTLVRQSTYT